MFKDAKIGDRVWSYVDAKYGRIVEIIGGKYPIKVEFNNGRQSYFTIDGKRFEADKRPVLFWDKIEFEIPKKPLPRLKVDAKVFVWNKEGDIKVKRHFKRFDTDGRIICFASGGTSWTSDDNEEIKYDYWELAEDNIKENND